MHTIIADVEVCMFFTAATNPESQSSSKSQSSLQDAPPTADTTANTSRPSTEPPGPPSTILEALQQRLDKYESAAAQAKEEGNGSKARRMGRIVKVNFQFVDFIMHKFLIINYRSWGKSHH